MRLKSDHHEQLNAVMHYVQSRCALSLTQLPYHACLNSTFVQLSNANALQLMVHGNTQLPGIDCWAAATGEPCCTADPGFCDSGSSISSLLSAASTESTPLTRAIG